MSGLSPAGWAGNRAVRWGALTLAGAVVLALAALVGVPLAARVFVWGLRTVLDGVLWLALAFSTGADLWQIAAAAVRALASSLVTPQAIGGTSGLVILGALALVGLRRLFESKKESQ